MPVGLCQCPAVSEPHWACGWAVSVWCAECMLMERWLSVWLSFCPVTQGLGSAQAVALGAVTLAPCPFRLTGTSELHGLWSSVGHADQQAGPLGSIRLVP